MSEPSSVARLHARYEVKVVDSVTTPSGSYEDLELSFRDIDGAKAQDIYNDIQTVKGFVKDHPILVTRDEDRVYRFYFQVRVVQFYNSELNVQKYAAQALK